MKSTRAIGIVIAATVAVILLAEVVVRTAGAVDIPTFRVDPQIGYYPTPSQHGALMHKNTWAINDRSMGVAAPYRWTSNGLLLVGDSVVYCGNPCKQPEKMGPVLSALTNRPVWPLAAGGWALENELQMVKANPDLLKLPTIVWVSNTGDFGGENAWTNPVNYPNHKPVSALLYLLRKTVLKPHDVVDSPQSAAATARWQADLRAFLDAYHGRLIWVLYPKKSERGQHPPEFEPLRRALAGHARVLDLSSNSAMQRATYRDAIHPTPQGDRVVAQQIAAVL